MAEQRSLKLPDDTVIYCYSDGSIEWLSKSDRSAKMPLIRRYGSNTHGYRTICINNRHYRIHRLIAAAFLPNPLGLPEVDHINRDRSDNRPENLRWASRKENCDNTGKVEHSIETFGVRCCENPKRYNSLWRKKRTINGHLQIKIQREDGGYSSITCTRDEHLMLAKIPVRERLGVIRTIRQESLK